MCVKVWEASLIFCRRMNPMSNLAWKVAPRYLMELCLATGVPSGKCTLQPRSLVTNSWHFFLVEGKILVVTMCNNKAQCVCHLFCRFRQ